MTVTLPSASTTPTTTSNFSTDLSAIRIRIGDVGGFDGTGRVYLTDERINVVLAEMTGTAACVRCVEMILADIARDHDYTAGSLSLSRTQATTQYEGVLKRLRGEMASEAGAGIFVGGVKYSTDEVLRANTDNKPRAFSVGMDRKW